MIPERRLTNEEAAMVQSAISKMAKDQDQLVKQVGDIIDKKWCIEKGIEAMKSAAVWFNDKEDKTTYYALELAKKYYDFLKS